MTTAIERHDAMVQAYQEQRQRLSAMAAGFARWDRAAGRFRADPRRELDDTLEMIASMMQPDDVLLDVGGGSGRYGRISRSGRCQLHNRLPARLQAHVSQYRRCPWR